jgi:hypothetical protein
VGLEMKPVGEPYAGNPHVRFVWAKSSCVELPFGEQA